MCMFRFALTFLACAQGHVPNWEPQAVNSENQVPMSSVSKTQHLQESDALRKLAMLLLAGGSAINPPGADSRRAAQTHTYSDLTSMHEVPQAPSRRSRRDALDLLLGVAYTGALTAGARTAAAFENAIPEYADYKDKQKRRGEAPKDLGIAKRTILNKDGDDVTFEGLRRCDGKPNCFTTTADELLDDRLQKGVDGLIPPWKPPADDPMPFQSLVKVIKNYEPGQNFIDGGGFKVVKETDNYIYVQYEALKKGYIDDVEWLLGKDGLVTLRSGSRVGNTDFAVNGIRLNYIADTLRKQGWTIVEITAKTHPDYFEAAEDARDQTFDKDRRRGTELESGRLARPTVG